MIWVMVLVALCAGGTQYIPFRDGPESARQAVPPPRSEEMRKREACRSGGWEFVYLQGAWRCLVPRP